MSPALCPAPGCAGHCWTDPSTARSLSALFPPTLLPHPCPQGEGPSGQTLVMALAWPCPALCSCTSSQAMCKNRNWGHRVCRAQLTLSVTLICLQFRKPLKSTRDIAEFPHILMRNSYINSTAWYLQSAIFCK